MEVAMPEPAEIELSVRVSDKNGVIQYGFAYDQDSVSPNNPIEPVLMNFGKGKFHPRSGVPGRLIWGMRGHPGGTMKVEVLRDGTVIKTRPASKIPQPLNEAIDYFEITVS
jgi:hypothetical protein